MLVGGGCLQVWLEEGVKWQFLEFGGVCIGIFLGYALAYNSETLCTDSTDKFGLMKSADLSHVSCSRIGGAPKYPSQPKPHIAHNHYKNALMPFSSTLNDGKSPVQDVYPPTRAPGAPAGAAWYRQKVSFQNYSKLIFLHSGLKL